MHAVIIRIHQILQHVDVSHRFISCKVTPHLRFQCTYQTFYNGGLCLVKVLNKWISSSAISFLKFLLKNCDPWSVWMWTGLCPDDKLFLKASISVNHVLFFSGTAHAYFEKTSIHISKYRYPCYTFAKTACLRDPTATGRSYCSQHDFF